MPHLEPEQAGQALDLPTFGTVEADRVLAQDDLFAVVRDKYAHDYATELQRRGHTRTTANYRLLVNPHCRQRTRSRRPSVRSSSGCPSTCHTPA